MKKRKSIIVASVTAMLLASAVTDKEYAASSPTQLTFSDDDLMISPHSILILRLDCHLHQWRYHVCSLHGLQADCRKDMIQQMKNEME